MIKYFLCIITYHTFYLLEAILNIALQHTDGLNSSSLIAL